MSSLFTGQSLRSLAAPSFNPAADNSGAKFADAFMRGGKLDIDLLAKGLGQLSVSNPAMAAQAFAELSSQFKQLSAGDQGAFDRLLKAEVSNATPDKGKAAQPSASETTAIKTQYGTFQVSKDGTLTPDKFRSQPHSTPEFKLWKDVHDGLIRNNDPEMGTSYAEDAAARWVFYSEGKISVDQISALNVILGGSAQTEKALAEYSSYGIPLNATFELPQQRLDAVLEVQSRNAANPSTTVDQQRITASLVQNARTGVEIAFRRFDSSQKVEGRAGLEFQYQNSDAVLDAKAQKIADSETNKLLAIVFAGPAIGAGAALLPEALALYRGGQAIKAGFTALAGVEQVTGGLNNLHTLGESQTGIVGGLINVTTGTRAGDTVSLVIQLAPEVYGVVALGKAAMTTYTSKAQALKAADALDDAAFKRGNIAKRAPVGTERQVLQTPEVKAQLAAESTRKAAGEAAEAELKANEIVVTGKRQGKPATEQASNAAESKQGSSNPEDVKVSTSPSPPKFAPEIVSQSQRTGIPPAKIQELLEMKRVKQALPLPETYMSKAQLNLHGKAFEEGGSRLTLQSSIDDYGLGQKDGTTFILTKSDADHLLSAAAGDLRKLEASLGLPIGQLDKSTLVRVDFTPQTMEKLNFRMPSGNETGANSQWLPGGSLPTGAKEAVIDGANAAAKDYIIKNVN